jgi:CheY-like chemotaxis protein
LKILIVDDDERIRQMIKAIIMDTVIIICECGDGAQVLDCYALHQPDFVLMDIMMAEVDRITATHQIMADYPSARVSMSRRTTARVCAKRREAGSDRMRRNLTSAVRPTRPLSKHVR